MVGNKVIVFILYLQGFMYDKASVNVWNYLNQIVNIVQVHLLIILVLITKYKAQNVENDLT